jgi:hypothetical protein
MAAQNTGFQNFEAPRCSEGLPIAGTLYSVQREICFSLFFGLSPVLNPAAHSICGNRQPKYVAAGIPRFEILVYIP